MLRHLYYTFALNPFAVRVVFGFKMHDINSRWLSIDLYCNSVGLKSNVCFEKLLVLLLASTQRSYFLTNILATLKRAAGILLSPIQSTSSPPDFLPGNRQSVCRSSKRQRAPLPGQNNCAWSHWQPNQNWNKCKLLSSTSCIKNTSCIWALDIFKCWLAWQTFFVTYDREYSSIHAGNHILGAMPMWFAQAVSRTYHIALHLAEHGLRLDFKPPLLLDIDPQVYSTSGPGGLVQLEADVFEDALQRVIARVPLESFARTPIQFSPRMLHYSWMRNQ